MFSDCHVSTSSFKPRAAINSQHSSEAFLPIFSQLTSSHNRFRFCAESNVHPAACLSAGSVSNSQTSFLAGFSDKVSCCVTINGSESRGKGVPSTGIQRSVGSLIVPEVVPQDFGSAPGRRRTSSVRPIGFPVTSLNISGSPEVHVRYRERYNPQQGSDIDKDLKTKICFSAIGTGEKCLTSCDPKITLSPTPTENRVKRMPHFIRTSYAPPINPPNHPAASADSNFKFPQAPFLPFVYQHSVMEPLSPQKLRHGNCREAMQSCVSQVLPTSTGSNLPKIEHSSPRKISELDFCKDSYVDSLPPKKRFKIGQNLFMQDQAQVHSLKVDHFGAHSVTQLSKALKPFAVQDKKSPTIPSAAAFALSTCSIHSSAKKASENSNDTNVDIFRRELVKKNFRLKRKCEESLTSPVAVPMPTFPRQKQRRTNAESNCIMLSSDVKDHEANMRVLPSNALPPVTKLLTPATVASCQMKKSFKMTYEITGKIGAGGGGTVYSG